MKYITAKETVNRALKSMALPIVASPSTTSDATGRQMWALFTELGQGLLSRNNRGWSMLLRQLSITTNTVDTEYPIPDDVEYIIDDTGWNETARIPLIGPLTSQQWRLLKARQLGGTTLRLQYMVRGDKLVFYFAPSTAQTIAFDYIGRGWVRDADNPLLFKDSVEKDGDIILYDSRMMITGLKYEFRKEKGFDTNASFIDFNSAIDNAIYTDTPKSVLSLSSRSGFPFLGTGNLPDTRYGIG